MGQYEFTALHVTCYDDNDIIMQFLLDRGAAIDLKNYVTTKCYYMSDLIFMGQDGRTALHLASLNGHEGRVTILLDKGSDIHNKDNEVTSTL